jgi:hypothetical protein
MGGFVGGLLGAICAKRTAGAKATRAAATNNFVTFQFAGAISFIAGPSYFPFPAPVELGGVLACPSNLDWTPRRKADAWLSERMSSGFTPLCCEGGRIVFSSCDAI